MTLKYFMITLLITFSIITAHNGLARTPPMGWNSWNTFLCTINETVIEEIIHAFDRLNLKKFGYEYIIIDDCWSHKERDANNRLQPNPEKFPRGIKRLADLAHSKGLKLGIYSDVGLLTCEKYPGSFGYYEIDAQTFADWHIDYLKFDYCNLPKEVSEQPWIYYQKMADALNKTGRPIVYSICNWGFKNTELWAPKMSNLWRTTLDIFPNYAWISIIVDMNEPLYKYVGPGKWNDPDMLEVGVNGTIANQPWLPKTTLTRREARTHFSLWSMMAAPLILGNDLRKVEKWVLDIVTNMDVININQDILGIQGRRMLTRTDGTVFNKCVNPKNGYCLNIEVWTKPLANDNTAVLFWNRADLFDENCPQYKSEDILIRFDEIGLKYKKYLIKDVWANKVMGIFENEFMAKDVLPHGDQLYLFMPKM